LFVEQGSDMEDKLEEKVGNNNFDQGEIGGFTYDIQDGVD
jgi:hypothetical protein